MVLNCRGVEKLLLLYEYIMHYLSLPFALGGGDISLVNWLDDNS